MPREAQVRIADGADAAIVARVPGVVFGDHGAGAGVGGGGGDGDGQAGSAAPRTGGAAGAGSGAGFALEAELFETGPVARLSGFLPFSAAFVAFVDLASPGLADLVERFHVLLPTLFLLFRRFREFDHGVHTRTFAFAGDEAFVRMRCRVVRWEGHDAADRSVAIDSIARGNLRQGVRGAFPR